MKALILTPLVLLFALQTEAALTLNIDSSSESFWFTGSDSGTFAGSPGDRTLEWQIGTGSNRDSLSVGLAFDISNLEPMGTSVQLLSFAVTEGTGAFLTFKPSAGGTSASLAGNGQAIFYGFSLPSPAKTYLASLSSSDNLLLTTGSGASPIQINAVPEPSTYVLMCVGVAAVAFFRRRSASALAGQSA